jgi:hypothetical protein
MGVSLHKKYLETSRVSKARWAANNRDRINAKRRERRLKARRERLAGQRCPNCTVLLSERLDYSSGHCILYCRKCVTDYPDEVRRHRWRRYHYRKTGTEPPKPKRESKSFIEAIKQIPVTIEEPMTIIPPDPFKGFTIKARVSDKTKTPILLCSCGNKYFKTRRGQTRCLHCVAYGGDNPALRSRAMVQ